LTHRKYNYIVKFELGHKRVEEMSIPNRFFWAFTALLSVLLARGLYVELSGSHISWWYVALLCVTFEGVMLSFIAFCLSWPPENPISFEVEPGWAPYQSIE
jgi:hypothetical protein